jgi:hypothetical protein
MQIIVKSGAGPVPTNGYALYAPMIDESGNPRVDEAGNQLLYLWGWHYEAPAPEPLTPGFWKQPITRVGLNLIDGADFPHVNYGYPSAPLLNWVSSIGVNHVRLSFRIEALEPTIGGPLDAAQVGALITSLDAAQAAGVMCNLSAHNFGRNNHFTGERRYGIEGPGSALSSFWGALAAEVKTHPALMAYGLMNEPPWEVTAWKDICQDCINVIRAQDARTPIIAPVRGSVLWNIAEGYNDDMAGLTGAYVAIEGHQYPDWDSAGTFDTHSPDEHYARPATYGGLAVNDWQAHITADYRTWLTTHNRVGYLGETGMPSLCWFYNGGWSEHWDARTSTGIAFWRDMHEVAIGVMGDAGIPTVFWCSGDHAEANKLFVGSHVVPAGTPNLYVEMITRALSGKPLIAGPAPT